MRRLAILALAGCAACGPSGAGGTVQITASGEALAGAGYSFPPTPMGGVFVDGWQVRFDKVIAVFDRVTLAEGANSAVDQSLTGRVIAELDGPFAVDLHRGGDLIGKAGDDRATPIGTLTDQNRNGGAAFDPTQLYGLSYETVAASGSATTVNFDAGDPDWQEMVARGETMLYVGEATFAGDAGGVGCTSTDPAYDFSVLPTRVRFRFGFTTPSSYLNCQNPDNVGHSMFQGEESPRGVQVSGNGATTAQITFHNDHPFWESFSHDTPAHFDQLAALARPQPDGSALVTLDDARGQRYTAFTDRSGAPLPWRWCGWAGQLDADRYSPPNLNPQMGFDSLAYTVPDYASFMAFDQSTEGHLNADGLCFVRRNY